MATLKDSLHRLSDKYRKSVEIDQTMIDRAKKTYKAAQEATQEAKKDTTKPNAA